MLDTRKLSVGGSVRTKSAWIAPAFAVALLLAANPAAAQECETDADCGFGFQCYSDTLVSTTTTTTGSSIPDGSGGTESSDDSSSGGSGTPVCGDSLCEFGETWDACPADCERYTYCAGAVCEASADCAEGYQCQAGGGNSGSSGGSSGSVCGDGLCDASETDSCASDCVSKCQQVYDTCETDADCAEDSFCDFSQGVSSSAVTTTAGEPIYEWLGVCAPNGTTGDTSGGTTGAAGEDGGESDDSSGAQSSITGGFNSISSSVTTGAATDGNANSGNGGPGSGGSAGGGNSGGSGHGGHGNGNGNGHHGNGNGNGNGWGWGGWQDWGKPGHGCSVGSTTAPGGAGAMLVMLAAALGWVAKRRRRVA